MARKMEAKGGKGGNQWDDGADHENVAKIHVRGGREGVQFIKMEYVKAGQTIVGPINGVSGRGFTQTFEIDHLKEEHLISVKGWYDNTSGVIQALQFETNQRSSKVIGYDENGTNKFTLEAGGNKITGFHGSAEANLKSLGVYFTPLPPVKLEIKGGTRGHPWDHGVYNGVRKLYVTFSPSGISHIMVDYDKDGKVETRQNGDPLGENRVPGQQCEFVLDYPNEYVTSIEGTCDLVSGPTNRIRSLSFKTSKDRTSPTYGTKGGQTFVFESKGRALVGLYGQSGWAIDAIGAYFGPPPPIPSPPPVEKLQSKGGDGGDPWDDGVFDGVRKLYVTFSPSGISHIMVDYVKDGKVETRQNGDTLGENRAPGQRNEFVVDYPNEYVTSIEGTCDLVSGRTNRIRSLCFKTSKGRTSPTYGTKGGETFVFESKGRALVGLYGRSGFAIDAMGAYFGPPPIPSPPVEKLQGKGGTGGSPWDHGVYTGVRKLYVTISPSGISHIKVDYDKDGKVETRQNGDTLGENRVPGQQYEFELDYPNEYVTSVEGTCDLVSGHTNRIRSLSFKTSKGRTSPTYGTKGGETFVFESKGRGLVGLYGRSGFAIDAIGAYFGPPPIPSPLVEKLQGKGGTGGSPWDHGVYTGVRKLYVTISPSGISHIKVDYDKDGKVETRQNGDTLGENRVPGQQYEFALDYPNEYVTSVEGTCDLVSGHTNRIRSLSFKTSKCRTSPTYGTKGGETFVFESKGRGLVGLYGRSGFAIDAIGAYFGPPPIPSPPVEKLQGKGGTGGSPWDHGVYTGVRKLYVTISPSGISHIKVDYDKDGKVETRQNGDTLGENRVPGQQYEFALDYPNEYVTSVEGTCDLVSGHTNRIRSLSFKTSKGRTSPTYGTKGGQTFVFESKGRALVGFYGRSGWAIDAIGAYFGPPPFP